MKVHSAVLLALVLAGLFGSRAYSASQSSRLVTACGHVDIPAGAATDGAICLGMCGPRRASHYCIVPGAVQRLAPPDKPLSGIEEVKLLIRGSGVDVGELTTVLAAVTGWEPRVQEGLRHVVLKPRTWTGEWDGFATLRLKVEGGGKIALSWDDTAAAFTVSRIK